MGQFHSRPDSIETLETFDLVFGGNPPPDLNVEIDLNKFLNLNYSAEVRCNAGLRLVEHIWAVPRGLLGQRWGARAERAWCRLYYEPDAMFEIGGGSFKVAAQSELMLRCLLRAAENRNRLEAGEEYCFDTQNLMNRIRENYTDYVLESLLAVSRGEHRRRKSGPRILTNWERPDWEDPYGNVGGNVERVWGPRPKAQPEIWWRIEDREYWDDLEDACRAQILTEWDACLLWTFRITNRYHDKSGGWIAQELGHDPDNLRQQYHRTKKRLAAWLKNEAPSRAARDRARHLNAGAEILRAQRRDLALPCPLLVADPASVPGGDTWEMVFCHNDKRTQLPTPGRDPNKAPKDLKWMKRAHLEPWERNWIEKRKSRDGKLERWLEEQRRHLDEDEPRDIDFDHNFALRFLRSEPRSPYTPPPELGPARGSKFSLSEIVKFL